MGLTQYIAAFITFVNNLVIPFLLGIAFLVFIINVIRFFVFGGTNVDSKEKAKSLAVYGILAFVLIIVFWGIINLLTNSLGLQALGERTARCPDYNPNCNIPPAEQTGGGANIPGNFGFGTGAADPLAPIGNNTDGFGNPASPGLQPPNPDRDTSPNTPDQTPTQPTPPDAMAGTSEFTAFVSTESSFKPLADAFIRTEAPDLFGRHISDINSDLFADLTAPDRLPNSYTDIDRVQASQRLAVIGVISTETVDMYQSQLESYYESLSPGYYQDSIAPTINTITKNLPPNVQTNFSQTLSLIENDLTDYYTSVGTGLTSTEAAQAVADDLSSLTTGSVGDRFAALVSLYDRDILRDPDNIIYDQFAEDLNVETMYAGNRPDF